MLAHDKLYEAYPELARVETSVDEDLKDTPTMAALVYSYEDRYNNPTSLPFKLKINPDALSKSSDELKSILLHEVQHMIQRLEGFATGGSPKFFRENKEAFKQAFKDMASKKYKKALYDELYSKVDETLGDEILKADEESLKASKQWMKFVFDNNGDETSSEALRLEEEYDNARENLVRALEKANLTKDDFAEIKKKARDTAGMDAFQRVRDVEHYDEYDLYKRLYGEIEARNTQTRMNMSEEERLATSPESTQDYSSDEAIVVFDDGTVANSYTYKPEKVRVENGIVDLTDAFEGIPTIDEVTKYIKDICKKTKDFATISPDWVVRTPKGSYREGHIIYSDKWKKMSNAQKERHNKYVMALNELLANASYLGDLPNKEIDNDKKKNVLKYHYFGVRVRIGKEMFDIVFDTEQFKKDSTQKPMSVSLYNVYEKGKSPFGANTTVSKYPIGDPNNNITPSGRDVNSPRYQTETEEKNLVVYHKISKDSLNKAIDLGGMPVPSLAIVKKDTDFVGFGGITLVGNKDMVNPQNAKNKVYNRDVWSTTFPEDEYKKVTQKAKDTFTKKFGKFFDETDSKNDLSSLLYTAERAYPGSAINEFQYLL